MSSQVFDSVRSLPLRGRAVSTPFGRDRLLPVVAIPVRNEAERIAELLRALGRQTYLAGADRALPVVLVFNNCTDRSAEVAATAAADQPGLSLHAVVVEFPAHRAHVGSARRLSLQVARALLPASGQGVMMITDADARPDEHWVGANLAAIEVGADVVGGAIFGDDAEEALLGPRFVARAGDHERYARLCDRLTAVIDPIVHDPWPHHRHHTGASLAFRAVAYDRVGGMEALPTREDLAFVSKLRAAGFRLRHDPDVKVTVSARTAGRALGGMADCLKQWVDMANADLPHLVESPKLVIARARLRSWLRSANFAGMADGQALASLLGLPAAEWCRRRQDGSFRHWLIERYAPEEPDAPATMPVAEAIGEMAAHLSLYEGLGHAA